MTHIIDTLHWRYAIKKYDSTKIIPSEELDSLIEATRLSASSYGLQPYTILNIKDKEIRQKLRAAAWNQPQVTDASDLLVFAVPTGLNDADVDAFIANIAQTRGASLESLAEYAGMIKGTVNSLTPEKKIAWSARQAYIALGTLLIAAADQKIDASPMEGFDAKQFDEILGLGAKGLTSVVITALGYRAEDDAYAKLAKVRKAKGDIYLEI